LQKFEANGTITYETDGFRVVDNTTSGVWHFEWDVKNNLTVPMTVQPFAKLYGCDVSRTGSSTPFIFTGASGGCPARGPAVDPSSLINSPLTLAPQTVSPLTLSLLPFTEPSAAVGMQDSTHITLEFQVSTLNISTNATSANVTNNASVVGKSVRDQFLKLHPDANKTRPAANPVQLRKEVCSIDASIGTVNGTKIVLQPGQSATITSTVNSKDWGFTCAPVNHALINYNVQAGSSTYQALKSSELIVFGQEESNICGT